MTRSRVLLASAASLAAALSLSACVPPTAGTASPFAEFAAADDAGQAALLLAAEDAVAAEITRAPDAAGAVRARGADTRQLVFRDIGSIAEGIGDVIRGGDLADQFEGQVAWTDGRHVGWTSENAGSVTGTYEYEGDGASSDSTFTLGVCPDASGRFAGHAKLVGDSGGVEWDVVFNFAGQVGDDAWADDLVVEAAGTLDAGGITQDSNTTVSFGFGARGTHGVNGDGSSGVADGSWDQAVDDFASKASLRFARLIEDNWRSGACVGVTADPAPASVTPGGELDFSAQPFSKVDGADIDAGTLEAAVIAGEGDLSPTGRHAVATLFTYVAPEEPGSATVQFLAVSRRGVGLVEVPVEISDGWAFAATYTGISSSALKCGGLTGEWVMASTGPDAYQATRTWTFDESLRGTASIAGSAGGFPFGGTAEMWLEESAPGVYELHASDGPNVFFLEPAPAGACD